MGFFVHFTPFPATTPRNDAGRSHRARRAGLHAPERLARRSALAALLALCCVWGVAACGGGDPGTEIVFVERSGCLACHRPLQPDGTAVGIEEAHPPVDGRALSCEDCHGGDPEARKQSEAHVLPLPGSDGFIKNLSAGELDDLDPAYLRFINPGDLRVAPMTCGAGSPAANGSGCHQDIVDTQETNLMATSAGILGVARYRAGSQRRGASIKAIRDVRDPAFQAGQQPAAVPSLDAMEEPRITVDEDQIGPYQDLYLTRECANCHLWSFGDNDAQGAYRSSGCTACHMTYNEDGLSESDDPTASKDDPPHPARHALTAAPPTDQCVRCHYRGGRVGLSYQGIRERGPEGTDPPNVVALGKALFGKPVDHYLIDEDFTQPEDETPPDVHFEAGMHCIDCHTAASVHGTGRIYTDTPNAVEIACEDCHGTADQEATLITRRGSALDHMTRDEQGLVWLTSKVTGQRHPVTQIKRSIDAAGAGSKIHSAMGRADGGFSHLDRVACASCHSAWVPTCFGCHVTLDTSEVGVSQLNGLSGPGAVTEASGPVRTDILTLMLDTQGRVAPSMPAVRMFFTALDGQGQPIIDRAVRTGPDGSPGMGHRAFSPHTTARVTRFQACTTCHPVEGTGENMDALMQVVGQGGADPALVTEDGAGVPWRLDALMDDEFNPEVLVGHDLPFESRPLTPSIIDSMLSVEVPAE